MDLQAWLALGSFLVAAGSFGAYVLFEGRRSRKEKPAPRKATPVAARSPPPSSSPPRRPVRVPLSATDAALDAPQTALLLRLLAKPEMNMREAAAAARSSPASARRAVADLSERDLVRVERRGQGAVSRVNIRLTARGTTVARKLLDASRHLAG